MKSPYYKASLKLLAATLFLIASEPLFAEVTSSYVSESKSTSEVFSSKVLKIYECQEEGGEYIAYVVDWRGHEVVIIDSLSMRQAKKPAVGDTVRCRMSQMQQTISGTRRVVLCFGFIMDREVSMQETESVMREVRERRLKRQETKAAEEKK